MAEKLSHTLYDDAPLSSARNPDPNAFPGGDREVSHAEMIGRTVTIARPRTEVFEFWRELQNLPRFMENVEAIEATGPDTVLWTVRGPHDKPMSWESRITVEKPDEEIAWESTSGSEFEHRGRVIFTDAPANRGTQVTATIVYRPPGGTVGKLIAKAFQRDPRIQARRDLRRLKQLLETGEVATTTPGAAAPRPE